MILKIQELRKKAGITQIELAKIVGVSVRTIQSYEANTIIPPADKLKKIAEALEISFTELIGIDQLEKSLPSKEVVEALGIVKNNLDEMEQILRFLGFSQEEIDNYDKQIDTEDMFIISRIMKSTSKVIFENLAKELIEKNNKYKKDMDELDELRNEIHRLNNVIDNFKQQYENDESK